MATQIKDGGWAWIIVASVAIYGFNLGGSLKLTGILYIEFLDLFQAGPVVTSWIGSVFGIMLMLGSVVGGYIADALVFQQRRIFLLCCLVVAALGVAISGWVPNVASAIICFGIMTGLAGGIAAAPILSLPGMYFKKRRSLAYGISFTGSTVASLVMPIGLTLLVAEYSLRGTMLIFAGFWLHTLILPASMTPLRIRPLDIENGFEACKTLPNADIMIKPDMSTEDKISAGASDIRPDTKLSLPEYNILPEADDDEGRENKINENVRVEAAIKENLKGIKYLEAESVQSSAEKRSYFSKLDGCCHFIWSYATMMKSAGVAQISLFLWCGYFCYFSQFLILPLLARELNMSKLEGALLVTLPNVPEFVSRIVVGVLIDKCHISKHKILIVSYLLAGALGIIISFVRKPFAYLVYSVVYGAVGGLSVPLGIPMLMDVVKPEQYGKASGMFPLLAGLANAIGLPILTLIAKQTGTFLNSIRLCAGVYLLAALVHLSTLSCNMRSMRLIKRG